MAGLPVACTTHHATESSSPSLVPAPLSGTLWRFKGEAWPAALQAFESPVGHTHENFCVYVGGLTDGLLACLYVDVLACLGQS